MKRAMAIGASAMMMAILAYLGLRAPRVASFDKNYPPRVRERIRQQIQAYFGNEPLDGIPWLDPKIDWSKFENWPDEIHFKGKTYLLSLAQIGDIHAEVERREQLVGIKDFMSTYRDPAAPDPAQQAIRPKCFWYGHQVSEFVVRAGHKKVFHVQILGAKRLFLFACDSPGEDSEQLEFFDKDGQSIGGMFRDTKGAENYLWRGQNVTNWGSLGDKAHEFRRAELHQSSP